MQQPSPDAIKAPEPSETPAVELTDAELDASLGAGYGIFAENKCWRP